MSYPTALTPGLHVTAVGVTRSVKLATSDTASETGDTPTPRPVGYASATEVSDDERPSREDQRTPARTISRAGRAAWVGRVTWAGSAWAVLGNESSHHVHGPGKGGLDRAAESLSQLQVGHADAHGDRLRPVAGEFLRQCHQLAATEVV